jgi:hypothetical protein
MQDKYIDHYAGVLFHKWFMETAKENSNGTAPWTAVVQNYLYTQNPKDMTKLRIQSFIRDLRQFMERAKTLPDPNPAPIVYDVTLSPEAHEEMLKLLDEAKAKVTAPKPTIELEPLNFTGTDGQGNIVNNA